MCVPVVGRTRSLASTAMVGLLRAATRALTSILAPRESSRGEAAMVTRKLLYPAAALIAIAASLAAWPVTYPSAQPSPASVEIDNDDIGGVVTGAHGPEAGVWVIAETAELG